MTVDKRIELKGKWVPLYSKCPCCGFDLNEFVDGTQDHGSADDIENYTDRAGSPGIIDNLDGGHITGSWMSRFVKWMVNPLPNAKNNAATRDYKGLPNGVCGKKSGPVQKDSERANHD